MEIKLEEYLLDIVEEHGGKPFSETTISEIQKDLDYIKEIFDIKIDINIEDDNNIRLNINESADVGESIMEDISNTKNIRERSKKVDLIIDD